MFQKRAEMAQVNIHSMILKEKRGETGKQNMKIISEKVYRPPLVPNEMLTEIKSILSNLINLFFVYQEQQLHEKWK